MDDVERISSPQHRDAPLHGAIVLSVNRGLWEEVSAALRSVRVACYPGAIHLYCYFAGDVADDDAEAMQLVGASVAADFPGHQVFEHCIASDPSQPIAGDGRADIVFARRERWD